MVPVPRGIWRRLTEVADRGDSTATRLEEVEGFWIVRRQTW